MKQKMKNISQDAQNRLVGQLFATEAFQVSPSDKPFWYTSGKIGPFYINTHFLYGSRAAAENLLVQIDAWKGNSLALTEMLEREIWRTYQENTVFHQLCDELAAMISRTVDLEQVDYFSGGERRDWFFSIPCAKLLGKKHLAIFKDLSAVEGFGQEMRPVDDLCGAVCVHVADLITEASSYERAWIPAIRKLNGVMPATFVVVDRRQGGMRLLEELGVEGYAMIAVDRELFDRAREQGLIDGAQHQMLLDYLAHPDESMKQFLQQHPAFLQQALQGEEKVRQRAKLCVEKAFYC